MTNKPNKLVTLDEYIIQSQNCFPGATGELSQLMRDIGLVAKIISIEVNKAGITSLLGVEGTTNIHGESVKKLDLFADVQLISALMKEAITAGERDSKSISNIARKKIPKMGARIQQGILGRW